eukprot:TRINITY_DN233_c0_g1_i1.p1 TRINITY_DN233_c0_g1~~TRINITY_DN233_c0_g1_i1.p1  ORF type:complete len:114 (+),score=0.64 TRINITY_DN233_c0_g1_i1:25-366(+)
MQHTGQGSIHLYSGRKDPVFSLTSAEVEAFEALLTGPAIPSWILPSILGYHGSSVTIGERFVQIYRGSIKMRNGATITHIRDVDNRAEKFLLDLAVKKGAITDDEVSGIFEEK